jgi:hypothetical protein
MNIQNNVEDPGSRSSMPTLFGVTSNVYLYIYKAFQVSIFR